MNPCLLTANIGGIDIIKPVPPQSVLYDYKCYIEAPLPLHELNSRMKSRFIKMQHSRFLINDIFIWIDGRAEITAPDFVEDMVKRLDHCDMVITKHPQRKTVGEEYEFMLDLMSNGNKYLNGRYDIDVIKKESQIIDWALPLYACGVFAYKATDKMRSFMNAWFFKTIEYSAWEQCWLSQLIYCDGLKIDSIGYDKIKIGRHI